MLQARDLPLVVDLDGSLLGTDTLYEGLFALLAVEPLALFRAATWLRHGRAGFKARLAERGFLDTATLPVNAHCLAYIQRAREAGSPVVLVSGADQRIVDRVAADLPVFDGAYGSSDGVNLSGAAKAEFLAGKYGEGGFDYIGDADVDVPVWRVARRRISVGADEAVRARLDGLDGEAVHLAPSAGGLARLRHYVRAMRPHQWLKNLLILLPLLAAHRFDGETIVAAMLALVAFSLTASSAYLLNDLVDLRHDRAHARKRTRPFASGAVPLKHGMILAPLLMLAGFDLALLTLPPLFTALLVGYYALTLAYSLRLKRYALVDIFALSGLYVVRIVAGGAATGIVLSPWLLAFSGFLFLSLAAVKRHVELFDASSRNGREIAGRGYNVDDLPLIRTIAVASGYLSALVVALYISSPAVTALYSSPMALWGVVPVLLFWVSRMMLLTGRGQMHDDPVVFAATDKATWLAGVVIAAIVAAGALL